MSLDLPAAIGAAITSEAKKGITKLVRTIGGKIGLLGKPLLTRLQAEADAEASKIKARAKNETDIAKEETKGTIDFIRLENQYKLEDRAADRKDELAERPETKRKLAGSGRTVRGGCAAIRIKKTEVRQQKNLEAIVQQAAIAMSDQSKPVDDKPVDEDWIARFMTDCQDISNKEMQSVWGRILAGETTKPGSFSLRTLAVVRTLNKSDAELFTQFCRLVWEREEAPTTPPRRTLHPLILHANFPGALNLQERELTRLEAMGLIRYGSQDVRGLRQRFMPLGPQTKPLIWSMTWIYHGHTFVLLKPVPPPSEQPPGAMHPMATLAFPLGNIVLTDVGEELYHIA